MANYKKYIFQILALSTLLAALARLMHPAVFSSNTVSLFAVALAVSALLVIPDSANQTL